MIKEIRNNQPSDMLRIEYMPGNTCNHKCHYCFPGSNEGDKPWADVELVKQNLGHLLKHYELQGKTKSNIFLAGGEPTLWKGIEDLCSYLKSNFDIVIEISTNGTRKLNWWKQHAKSFDHVGVSVHREFANVDHLIEVCDTLYEQGTFVNADVLMDPAAFDTCLDIVEKLKTSKHAWPIIAKVVHFNGAHRYTDAQLAYFDDSIKRYPSMEWYKSTIKKPITEVTITQDDDSIITTNSDSWITRNKLNYFKGWQCNIGVDFIKIFPDGTITSNCQHLLYNESVNYNLYQENFLEKFTPNISPVICSKSICVCNEEVICNKRKVNA
jgi:organic radical activating enzyme